MKTPGFSIADLTDVQLAWLLLWELWLCVDALGESGPPPRSLRAEFLEAAWYILLPNSERLFGSKTGTAELLSEARSRSGKKAVATPSQLWFGGHLSFLDNRALAGLLLKSMKAVHDAADLSAEGSYPIQEKILLDLALCLLDHEYTLSFCWPQFVVSDLAEGVLVREANERRRVADEMEQRERNAAAGVFV